MPSASAAAGGSSNRRGSGVEPRPITGPEPNLCEPSSFSSVPGSSVAKVTSTAIAMSGRSEYAVVREPANVISSCATAAAITSPGAPPASATSRAASNATKQPRRLSSERDITRPLGSSTGSPPPVGQPARLAPDHADVPDPHPRAGVISVARADVDVQLAQLGHLLAVLL